MMQDYGYGQVFLIREVPHEECLDRLCLAIHSADLIRGLRFIQSGQLDHAIGL